MRKLYARLKLRIEYYRLYRITPEELELNGIRLHPLGELNNFQIMGKVHGFAALRNTDINTKAYIYKVQYIISGMLIKRTTQDRDNTLWSIQRLLQRLNNEYDKDVTAYEE